MAETESGNKLPKRSKLSLIWIYFKWVLVGDKRVGEEELIVWFRDFDDVYRKGRKNPNRNKTSNIL
jgi:hypothetical protein